MLYSTNRALSWDWFDIMENIMIPSAQIRLLRCLQVLP